MKPRMAATVAVLAAAMAASVGGMAVAAPVSATPSAAIQTKTSAVPVKAAPGTAFTAYDHTWRAVVSKGRLSLEGKRLPARSVKVSRSAFAKGVEFTGRHRGTEVALVVRSGRCVDVTGENTGMRATLQYGRRVLRGCAVPEALPAR